MNRPIARLSVLLVLGAVSAAGCGGKVVFEISSGGGGGGGSTTVATSTKSAVATTTVTATSTGSSMCDPKTHTIDAASYDLSCNVAADCMTAFLGDFCQGCDCALGAINVADAMKYQAEAQMKSAGVPPGGCFCPASHAVCAQGQCTAESP